MNRTAVFSKTGKGLLEIKNKANRLSKDQYRVLNLVDGKANLVDLADKAKVSEIEVRKILSGLSDSGYIKEFTNPAGDFAGSTVPPSTSYADDLDFTSILGPAQSAKPGFYQSAALEQRQREEAERKASEAAASRGREEAQRRAKEEAENRARAEAIARKVREDAERRAREEFERQERAVDEMRNKADSERQAREDAERRAREAKDAMLHKAQQEKLEAERHAREEAERRVKIQVEARARVELEKRAREEAERKAREDEERRRQEEESKRRREEEEKRRREEEEKRRREEEEKRRRDEEEKRRREEEDKRRREEEERRRQEEEKRRRQEEEERKRKEDEERKRKEDEERRRREEEERRRREEEERNRREEEERKRWEEEERKRKEEEEERKRKDEAARRLQDEQERLKRDLEEKQRREQEELLLRMEEERRRLEDDDYRRRAEEEERRSQEVDKRQREEEERVRRQQEEEEAQRREADQRRRKEEDERQRREQDERRRREDDERRKREQRQRKPAEDAFPSLDMTSAPTLPTDFDTDLEALKRAEAQVEREFQVKEEAIRKALEEQERRFRMEEEARAAMDRAERESRERADREARDLAFAAERARKDAEHRAREEGARRAQDEKERRAKEQDERRKQSEENLKKRERERREAEQRAREEELTRRRKEQEEQDRRKHEIDRLQGESRRRAFGPGKMAAAVLVGLVVLAAAVVEVVPMSAYAPSIEKTATQALGEPVRVGSVRASLFPSFHVELSNVTVGNAEDVKIAKVVAYLSLGSAFSDDKDIGKLVLDSASAPQEALARLPRWLSTEGKTAQVSLERVQFRAAKLEAKGVALPTFDADILLASDRSVRGVTIETSDGHFTAELTPREQSVDVVARGRGLVLPLGPAVELTDFTARGVANGSGLRITELEYSLYGGQGKGTASVSWGAVWTLEGAFELQRVELEPAMNALKADIPSDGTLDAKGRYAMQAVALDKLFDAPRVDAVFMVRKGNLSGLDLVRALQSPSRDGTAGGKTKFEELSGSISTANGRMQYNGVKLAAGALTASGQGEVEEDKEVNGRAYVELRSSANTIRGSFRVQGSLKGMVLRP